MSQMTDTSPCSKASGKSQTEKKQFWALYENNNDKG